MRGRRVIWKMKYSSFSQIVEQCQAHERPRRVAVAGAAEEHVIRAVISAAQEGIAVPVLVGDAARIRELLEQFGEDPEQYEIVHGRDSKDCGEKAVGLVRDGCAEFIMKGMAETRDVLKPLVKRENGMNTGRTMNIFSYNEVPQMSRLLAISDGGMILYPTLEQKRDIILNAVDIFHRLGVENPSIAVLAGVEKVNPRMPETVDAAALEEMNRNGEIPGCEVVGPVSFDIAFSREIAERKGFQCPYCGDFDMVLVPNMSAGNLMHKAMILHGGTKMAGIVTGAKVPVVLTSRGASAEEKFVSMALASLVAGRGAL